MENSNYPISPVSITVDNYTGRQEQFYGLTKREYFAGKYTNASVDFFNETSADFIMKFLGYNKDLLYSPFEHYPAAVAKMQLIMADELLKQLSKPPTQ